MTQNVLISPLGFSAGAVSGVYFALDQVGVHIDRVVTVGTLHDRVKDAAELLDRLFRRVGSVDYKACYIAAMDLRGREQEASGPFAARMGLYIDGARKSKQTVHVAVTGGRSGMGALAALAAQIYRADHLYHLWVNEKIEREGTVKATPDPNNPYVNPTVEDGLCELVPLPFADLSQLVEVVRRHRANRPIPEGWSSGRLIGTGPDTLDALGHYVPAGLPFALGTQIHQIAQMLDVQECGLLQENRTRWLMILEERFNEEELRTLCFHLKVDYDSLPAAGKDYKARELIQHLERRESLQRLLEVGEEIRPDIAWRGPATIAASRLGALDLSPQEAWRFALSILVTAGALDEEGQKELARLMNESIGDRRARHRLEKAAEKDDLGPLAWWKAHQEYVLPLIDTGTAVATFVLGLVELWAQVQGIV
jgi:hypothetical protein